MRTKPGARAGSRSLIGFLLDTNVISMLAPARAQASASFLEWLERADSAGHVFLSVVAIHAIETGIALLDHRGATAKAAALKLWRAGLVATYNDKLIPIDTEAAARAGRLEAKAAAAGHTQGMADAIVAGIAQTEPSSSSPATRSTSCPSRSPWQRQTRPCSHLADVAPARTRKRALITHAASRRIYATWQSSITASS